MSNKKQVKPEWTYMRSPVQEDQEPRYFFYDTLSERMTQTERFPLEWVEENFKLVGYVRVNGKERIHIFERAGEADSTKIRYYDAEHYEEMYKHIDWLSEYRCAYQHGLSDNDLFELGNYLETQTPSPQALLIFYDTLVEKALNYYYAGDARRITALPAYEAWWNQFGLNAEAPLVFLVDWATLNDRPLSNPLEGLAKRYGQKSLNKFGSLVVVTLKMKP